MIPYREITIDLVPRLLPPEPFLSASQYDNGRPVKVYVQYDGTDFPLGSGVTAKIQVRKPSGKVVIADAQVSTGTNVITFNLLTQMTAEYGLIPMELSLTGDGQEPIGTANWITYIEKSPASGSPSDTWVQDLDEKVEQATEAAEDAEQNALDAEAWAVGQRNGADVPDVDPTYENNAKYYALSSISAKEAAEAAASAAAESAGSAADSATDASGSAESASGSASASAGSAAQAAGSATAAASSASAAAQSAGAAAQSATESAGYATASENSAGVSAGAAEAAGQSATAAAGSASTAAGHATNAANSATASAGSAAQSAQSATASATSAGQAAGSATAAAGSADAADASADRAQEILDSIPEDYSELSEDVSDLKSALSSNTTNINTAKIGNYRYSNGIIPTDTKYAGLDNYVAIDNDKQITVTLFNLHNFGTWYIYQFDSSGTKIGSTITVSGGLVKQTFTPEETAVKIYIFMYRSSGIVLNDNSCIQIEYGYGSATYIPPVTAYDRIARPQAESAKDNLYGGIPYTEKNGYYNADGSISTSHPNGEKYTNKVSVDLYKEIKIIFNFSESKTIAYQICTYDSNGDFIERKATSTTGSHLEVVPTFDNNVKYAAFSYRTYDETAVSLTAYISVPKMWEDLSKVSVSDIQGIKQTSNIGLNSARFKPLYDHLFVSRGGDYVSIPHESVYHVRLSRLFGFNMIEANVWETGTDGVYIVNHLNGGTFGNYFYHVDGVTDISNINVGDVTWDWISANVRYNSRIVKYRTRPCTLEEFLSECRQQNIIPFITCSDPAVYEIATKYMGEYNFVAYNASRSTCPNGIIYRWSTLTSKDDIVAQCESVGIPYIYGMSNPTAFTDTELKDIVAELHKRGFWIGTSYQDANWYKYSSFGFDFNGAIQQINRITNGNICNFDAVYGFNEYTYTNATEADGILTFTADGSITPNVPDVTACICGIDIEIVFNGSITIPSKGEFAQTQTYFGDGLLPLFVAIPVINDTPSITLTVASGTVVTDFKFKASKF